MVTLKTNNSLIKNKNKITKVIYSLYITKNFRLNKNKKIELLNNSQTMI